MIGIEVNGEFLDLFPDTRINMKLINPIFAIDNVIPGSYSIPFTVPGGDASPRNARLLKNPDVIGNQETRGRFSATLYVDGVKFKKGIIRNGDSDQRVISINFIFGLATLSEDFKQTKIRSICSSAVTMASNSYTKRVKLKAISTDFPYSISINGFSYEITDNGVFGTTINGDLYAYGSGINGINSALFNAINANADEPRATAFNYNGSTYEWELKPYTGADEVATAFTVIIPSEYNDKWEISADDFEAEYNDDIRDFLDDYLTATPIDTRLRFPMIYNDRLYEVDNLIKYPGMNTNHGGAYKLNHPAVPSAFLVLLNPVKSGYNISSIAPMVRLKWVIDQIATNFGVTFEGSFFDDPDYPKIVFYHSNCLDQRIPFVGPTDWIYCRRSFNTNEFLPDWTVPELLKAVQSRFNCTLYLNERSGNIRMQLREPIVSSSSVVSIDSLCSPLKGVKPSEVEGILFEAETDSEDLLSTADQFNTGTPNLPIKTPITGLRVQQNFTDPVFAASLNLPKSQRKLSDKIPGVLTFYALKNNGTYDYATANIEMADGPFVLAGATGLALRRWKSYLRFLVNRDVVSLKAQFELRHLLDIDWEKRYEYDRINYLIAGIDLTITMRGVEPSNVELYPTGIGVLP